MRVEYKIFLASFSIALVVFLVLHLVWLPFYWAHASSQLVRPSNLYSSDTWSPPIVFYSVLAALAVLIVFELYSKLSKGLANEGVIFVTTLFLTGLGLWLFIAFAGLRWGHPLVLPLGIWNWYQSETGYALVLSTFFFSFIGAVSSTLVYDVYKLARYAKKRLSKARAE